jgi:hypothetical protein
MKLRRAVVALAALVVLQWGCAAGESVPSQGGSAPTNTGAGGAGAGGSGGQPGGTGPGAGGSGGVAGSGGAGGACADADGDGSTICEGDCDDNDPTIHPDAPEVCGDDVDNNCDGSTDPASLCNGTGTFVSALAGDDTTGTGTQLSPVKTITEGIHHATDIVSAGGTSVAVYVAQGHYAEKITLIETISLLGGYDCSSLPGSWLRDPTAYDSVIVDLDLEGVLANATITRQTLLDGFAVMGFGTGLGQDLQTAAVTVAGGSPTVSNSRLYGAVATDCGTWCSTTALDIRGPTVDPSGPLVTGNVIQAGDSPFASFGIRLGDSSQAAIADIAGNVVKGGIGSRTRAINAGGAGNGTWIRHNDLYAGSQFGTGTSFALLLSGTSEVDGNRINANPAEVGSCSATPGGNNWCGGIEALGATAIITNNVVLGMPSPRSTAVFLWDAAVPFGVVTLSSNTLDGSGLANGISPSVSTAIACRTTQGFSEAVGKIRNNILLGGRATRRFGMFEDDQPLGKTCQPAVYANNDFFFAPQVGTTDNAHRRWTNEGTVSLLPTVTEVNSSAIPGVIGNFSADPLLDATMHLLPGSPCINAGVASEAPAADIDDEARPMNGLFDVGADEAG